MKVFKIFYSWQSDLPSNKTRNFIRECIDEAIDLAQETEAIEAERDEATKNTTGSPNIVTTIFSKIDNCDLFVADISLCFTGDTKEKNKRSPNPNVLLELGYAAKTLGWDHIICLCNNDFGTDYPFDVSHNRITGFRLEGQSRKEVKSDISRILFTNIRDLRGKPPLVKAGMATHIIGTYSFTEKKVISTLGPIEIGKQKSYILHNKDLLCYAQELFKQINEINNEMVALQEESIKVKKALDKVDDTLRPLPETLQSIQQQKIDLAKLIATSYQSGIPVVWKRMDSDRRRIKAFLNEDVDTDFFSLGELKEINQLFSRTTVEGTEKEKEKYGKLKDLSDTLSLIEIRHDYIKTFEGMMFIPIAIQNVSTVMDTEIRIVLRVEIGEIVDPDEHLIWSNYEGIQGELCRDDENDMGIIAELFSIPEDGIIKTEELPYIPSMPRMPEYSLDGMFLPEKTSKDYQQELEEYIAVSSGKGYYEFNIQTLRPGECKWFCCGLLIRPQDNNVLIKYRVHSACSSGNLEGTLFLSK